MTLRVKGRVALDVGPSMEGRGTCGRPPSTVEKRVLVYRTRRRLPVSVDSQEISGVNTYTDTHSETHDPKRTRRDTTPHARGDTRPQKYTKHYN